MSQIKTSRRVRSFRRSMIILVLLALAALGYLYWQSRQEKLPNVRVAAVQRQDISAHLSVTAQIRPLRSVEYSVSGQTIKSVLVKAGDEVRTGDVLMTFDLAKLQDQYSQALSFRDSAEKAATEAQSLVQRQASTAKGQSDKLQRDVDSLSRTLNRITTNISVLRQLSPVDVLVSSDLRSQLEAKIAAYNPSAPDAREQLGAIVALIQTGVTVTRNPAYDKAVNNIDSGLSSIDDLFGRVAGGTLNVAGSALNPAGMTQTAGLFTQAQSAVASAAQAEAMARQALENAKAELRADFDGLVVSVNAKPGQTLPGSTALSLQQTPVAVLYDNRSLIAAFKANRFDSSRMREGMTVTYEQDGRHYVGEITYMAKVANSASLPSGSGSSSLLGMGGSGLSGIGEPTLDIEMSIRGFDLDALVIGFNIDASIETSRASQVLCVPAEALRRELGNYFVYVLRPDQTLEQRVVKPGIQSDTDAEITVGLSEDEQVVLNPSSSLAQGARVHVVQD